VTRLKEDRLKTEAQTKQTETYSAIAKQAVQDATPPPQPIINLTNKTQIKLTAIILEAHVACMTGQGRFGQVLSDSLKLNYDIDTKFPDRDSQKIFNMYMDSKTTPTPYNSTDENYSSTSSDSDMETEQAIAPPPTDKSVRPKTTKTKPKSPKKTTQTAKQKRKATSPATTTAPDSDSTRSQTAPHPQMTFLRSDKDNSEIPSNPNNDWFISQLRQKGDYGLKLMTTNCNPKTVLTRIEQGHPKLTLDFITLINHDHFRTKDRLSEDVKRSRHSSQPTESTARK